MNVVKATARYEDWLRAHTAVVESHLRLKHQHMAESVFSFLRATFYRWVQVWPEVCRGLAKAPPVLAVGDLHVENFGTWRDVEGRLVWGINDFDEAAVIPFALDLVRLATSVRLAPDQPLGHGAAAAAILDGYGVGLVDPRPTLLDEQERWMRPYVACADKERDKFWAEIDGEKPTRDAVPDAASRGLRRSLPDGARI